MGAAATLRVDEAVYRGHLEVARQDGHEDVEVRALSRASLNGRERQLMVDPKTDLTAGRHNPLRASGWILPLTTPLNSGQLARK